MSYAPLHLLSIDINLFDKGPHSRSPIRRHRHKNFPRHIYRLPVFKSPEFSLQYTTTNPNVCLRLAETPDL